MDDQNKNKKHIIQKELSYDIAGILFKVHNEMGRFCREKQYCDRIEELLKEKGIKYKRELRDNDSNRLDFMIEDKILLEVKAKNSLNKDDYFQVKRYLELNNVELGLLVNFRYTFLKPKRIINTKYL